MCLLHAPIDQLLQVDPQLGGKFAVVNHDLEALTKSVPPSHKLGMDDSAADDLRVVDAFGHLLLKQRGCYVTVGMFTRRGLSRLSRY